MHLFKENSGLTLLELLIVVGTVGILSAVAIPQYQKYQAYARQTEAKINLAAAYTALQSYVGANGTYTTCLGQIGFQPSGTRPYYSIGFDDWVGSTNTCGVGVPLTTCNTYNYDAIPNITCPVGAGSTVFIATNSVRKGVIPPALRFMNLTSMNSSQFVLAASGSVYDPCPGTDIPQNCAGGGLGLDFWTINENRTVVQAFQGIY